MAQIRELKKRMVAVRTIQRITKTMQMIATAKFNAALQRARASRPYTDTIHSLVAQVAAAAGDVTHPLLQPPAQPTGEEYILVITSDRGLCGAFNGQVLRAAERYARSLMANGKKLHLAVAGKKGLAFFRFARIPVAKSFSFGDKPKFADVDALGEAIIQGFTSGKFDAVHVAYMRFFTAARQAPEVTQLVPMKPIDADAEKRPVADMEFSPDAKEILADLLPRALKVQLYQCFVDSAVSEQAMRRVAMKAATDNASSFGRLLRRNFNRARQAKITTELTEIVSGASALE